MHSKNGGDGEEEHTRTLVEAQTLVQASRTVDRMPIVSVRLNIAINE